MVERIKKGTSLGCIEAQFRDPKEVSWPPVLLFSTVRAPRSWEALSSAAVILEDLRH